MSHSDSKQCRLVFHKISSCFFKITCFHHELISRWYNTYLVKFKKWSNLVSFCELSIFLEGQFDLNSSIVHTNVSYCKPICVAHELAMPLVCWFSRAILLEDITRSFFWVWCRTFEGCAVCNLLLVPFFIPTTADEYGVSFPSFMLQTVKQSFLPVLLINTYTFVGLWHLKVFERVWKCLSLLITLLTVDVKS